MAGEIDLNKQGFSAFAPQEIIYLLNRQHISVHCFCLILVTLFFSFAASFLQLCADFRFMRVEAKIFFLASGSNFRVECAQIY